VLGGTNSKKTERRRGGEGNEEVEVKKSTSYREYEEDA
jgi:hypothetical protein